MIEFMDEITDAVEQFPEEVAEIAKEILLLLVKAVILLTTPAWILPYKLLRDTMWDSRKMKEREGKEDGENDGRDNAGRDRGNHN